MPSGESGTQGKVLSGDRGLRIISEMLAPPNNRKEKQSQLPQTMGRFLMSGNSNSRGRVCSRVDRINSPAQWHHQRPKFLVSFSLFSIVQGSSEGCWWPCGPHTSLSISSRREQNLSPKYHCSHSLWLVSYVLCPQSPQESVKWLADHELDSTPGAGDEVSFPM